MASWSDDTKAGIGVMDADLIVPSLLHELRQPLQGADAAAALLERAVRTLGGSEEWQMLRVQLARLSEIVNGYEDLLRPGEAEPAAFDVAHVVSRAVELLAHRVRPMARRFRLAFQDGGCAGYGAPGALIHAATNLLANALDAIEGAKSDARVEVRVLPVARGVEVRVSDEGVGIPMELRAHIFEPRFTTKGAQRGSGLGLHVARRLMSRYGGEVSLVGEQDPARTPWAVTEFCILVPAPPARGAAR
jgi:signal transduction histidine kinase